MYTPSSSTSPGPPQLLCFDLCHRGVLDHADKFLSGETEVEEELLEQTECCLYANGIQFTESDIR